MTGEPWLYAALVVLGALHLLVVAYSARRAGGAATLRAADSGKRETSPDDETTPGDGETADDRVVCPHCDAVNELNYRFCRVCVAELPGADVVSGTSVPARDGNVL